LDQAIELLNRRQTNDAFKFYRLSLREWNLPIIEYLDFYSECVEAAKLALDRNSQDADALYVLARMGMKQSNEERLEMAKRCVELDPSIPDFHHYLACTLGYVRDHNNGLRAVERAIEMLPNHPDWLYDRATHLRLREDEEKSKKCGNAAEAYLKFLSSNPRDHRKYPEACYCLAHIYASLEDMSQSKIYYQKGLEAEDPSIRLPCFEPVEENFPPKRMTQEFFKVLELGKIHLKKIPQKSQQFFSLPQGW